MHDDREHVISVVLNHEEWKEFLKLQPQPVNWLRERIQEMIRRTRAGTTTSEARVQAVEPATPARRPSRAVNPRVEHCSRQKQ